MILDNVAGAKDMPLKFNAYICDQAQVIHFGKGATLHINPRELLILRSDLPCKILTSRSYTTTGLVIDPELFTEYVPDFQGIIARRLGYPYGLQDILANTLDSCVALSKAGRFETVGPSVTRSFLELLAVLNHEGVVDELSVRSTSLDIRCAQVKAYIDRNFRDADINVSMIARNLRLTPRYVQMAFEHFGQTPLEYLRQKRIEACANELLNCRRRSITEICFDNGFNSSSHFSTEFKRVYGMTPRDWRLSDGGEQSDQISALLQ